MENRNITLRKIAQHLDIAPSDFKSAQERFAAVGTWLAGRTYLSGSIPDIYFQGSFRLGTVIRPYRDGKDADFDVDQVFELASRAVSAVPQILKQEIGDRLKDNADYSRMLDAEGRRCWTLQYASENDRAGFHLDVLPALKSTNYRPGEIDITDKRGQTYSWSNSNPKGYYEWFKSKNPFSNEFMEEQRNVIFESNSSLYVDENEVPKQLFRSPLQRSIQLMKRHRDVYFTELDHKPISVIITTICAHLYANEDIIETIQRFTQYVIKRHSTIIGGNTPEPDGIFDYNSGSWLIPNPADEEENFADKWNKDPELPKAFFMWTYQLDRDVRGFERSGLSDDLSLGIKSFGGGSSFPTIQTKVLNEHPNVEYSDFTNQLLSLIHLGIEGKVDWKIIEAIALRNVNETAEGENKDVARVNYYQTIRHQKRELSASAVVNLNRMLDVYVSKPNFIFCVNLLLGKASIDMLKACINDTRDLSNVMSWPIVRLIGDLLFVPH